MILFKIVIFHIYHTLSSYLFSILEFQSNSPWRIWPRFFSSLLEKFL